MAGRNNDVFEEKVSPFLMQKMEEIKFSLGENSKEYKALALQYKIRPEEHLITEEINSKHWDADLKLNGQIRGLERLYFKTVAVEITMICAAHCRYCLRANYNVFTLSEHELLIIARYCGSSPIKNEIDEILITGGDPIIIPNRLSYFIETLANYAPNIKTIRVATRLPLQDPDRIDENVYRVFKNHASYFRFELATQINHPTELFPESIAIFNKIKDLGITVYSQNVLLKGINDDIDTLIQLYTKMRQVGIESHYLFHCVPIKGIGHFRCSVKKGIELARSLSNSGVISGRSKPAFALMTDIGKITLYDGTIIGRVENKLYIQSAYNYQERLKNNPTWKLPKTAEVDDNGFLRIWYQDGNDD